MYSVLTSSVSAEDAEALGEKEQLTLSKFLGKEREAQRDKVSDMPKATASGSVIKVSKLYFQCSFHSSMLLLPPLKKKVTSALCCAQETSSGRRAVFLGMVLTSARPDVRHVDQGS